MTPGPCLRIASSTTRLALTNLLVAWTCYWGAGVRGGGLCVCLSPKLTGRRRGFASVSWCLLRICPSPLLPSPFVPPNIPSGPTRCKSHPPRIRVKQRRRWLAHPSRATETLAGVSESSSGDALAGASESSSGDALAGASESSRGDACIVLPVMERSPVGTE
jgi:hypothetical protein